MKAHRFRLPNWAALCVSALLLGCGASSQIGASSFEGTALQPGNEFSDCEDCPPMVVVPAGSFTMGSPPGERYRGAEPQHEVVISEPFAVGKYEITFDEWNACLAEGGCGGYEPLDHDWGQGNRPVVQVNFDDAMTYVEWLRRKTGYDYRLLSESEWEYAARAGTQTPFSFGDTISSDLANYDGRTGYDGGPTSEFREQTLPVGSFEPNAFGLYDMHGNVWEWVQDCWNDIYTDAMPTDGNAWLDGDCSGRVMRGGSWEDYSGELRSAARVGSGRDESYWSDGFRVARSLD